MMKFSESLFHTVGPSYNQTCTHKPYQPLAVSQTHNLYNQNILTKAPKKLTQLFNCKAFLAPKAVFSATAKFPIHSAYPVLVISNSIVTCQRYTEKFLHLFANC